MLHAGHVGINTAIAAAFLYFTPDTYPIGLVVFSTAIIISLSSLPDIDQRIPLVTHRGITHSLTFGLIIGLIIGRAYAALPIDISGTTLIVYGVLTGISGIAGHLIGDFLTPHGIKPFQPFINTKITLNLVKANNTIVNTTLFILGAVVYAYSLIQTTITVTI